MTLDDAARHFLQTYAAGGEPDGGWLHAKALQQTRLDYSQDSLVRLDGLLAQIRERAAPTQAELQSVRGNNFQSLIVFYLMEIVRRRTRADIVWRDRASALRALPPGAQLPDTAATRLLAHAADQAMILMPLDWLNAQLLPPGRVESSARYVASVIADLERDGPAVWWRAVHAMGRIASWQMMMAADGGAVVPMMLGERKPDTWVMLVGGGSGLPRMDIDASLDMGIRKLEENPESHAWQVLSYDGWYDADDGAKLDAVMVVAQTHGARPLKLKLAFPYRPATAARRFAILQPVARGGNVPDETVARFGSTLERGIQSIKWSFGTTWNELREGEGGSPPPSPPASPSPARSGPPQPAWAAPAPARARAVPADKPPPKKPGWKLW